MERQREKARASWAGSGDAATEAVWFGLRESAGATEFLGYETETAEGVVAALVKDGKEVKALRAGENGAVVLNQTPFYAESGGQVGDTGIMRADGVRFRVTDTQKRAGDLFVHSGTVEEGTLKVGAALALEVDHDQVCQGANTCTRPVPEVLPVRSGPTGSVRTCMRCLEGEQAKREADRFRGRRHCQAHNLSTPDPGGPACSSALIVTGVKLIGIDSKNALLLL